MSIGRGRVWLLGVLIGLLAMPVLAQDDLDLTDDRLGAVFARLARDILASDPLTIESIELATMLTNAALELDPGEVDYWRLRRDVALLSEEDDRSSENVARDSAARILKLDPDDDVARLWLVMESFERYHSIEERQQAIDATLRDGSSGLGPAERSRLALELARMLQRSGDIEGYGKWLAEAIVLDASNAEAANLAAQFFRQRIDDPFAEAELLTVLLMADPADIRTQVELGDLMLENGAFVGASRMYGAAISHFENRDQLASNELIADRAIAEWGAGRGRAALRLIQSRVYELNRAVQQRMLDDTPEFDPDELARSSAPLPPVLGVLQAAIHFGSDDLIESLQVARTGYDSVIMDARGAETPDPLLLAQLHLERAWLEVWLGGDVEAVRADLEAAEVHHELTAEARSRFEGWMALQTGDLEGGLATLAPLAGDDPASKLGLAVANQRLGRRRDAALLYLEVVREHAGTVIGVWSARRLVEILGQQVPIDDLAKQLEDLARSIPQTIDRTADNPTLAFSLRVRPIKTEFDPFEPVIVNIEITNNTKVPLAIGHQAPLKPNIYLEFDLISIGIRGSAAVESAIIDISRRLRIEAGETLVIPVDLRQHDPGRAFLARPVQGWMVRVRAQTNLTVSTQGALRPGPLGLRMETPPFHVDGVRASDAWINDTIVALRTEKPPLTDLTMVANLIAIADPEGLTPSQRQIMLQGLRNLEDTFASLDPSVQAWLLATLPPTGTMRRIEEIARASEEAVVQLMYLMFRAAGDTDVYALYRESENPAMRRAAYLAEAVTAQRANWEAGEDAAEAGSESVQPLMSGETSPAGLPLYRRPWAGWGALLIGIVLLGAAVWMVYRRRTEITAAIEAAQHPSALAILILLASVPLNMLLTSALFRLLLCRYGHVGHREMFGLIASAGLLNYLPLRAGLVGRVTYQKVVCGISVVDSAKTVLQAVFLTAGVGGWLATSVLLADRLEAPWWVPVVGPLPLLLIAGCFPRLRIWAWAIVLRALEQLLWALRYLVAFEMIDHPIAPAAAVAMAFVSAIAQLVPLASGGLGVREWAIGLVAPLLSDHTLEIGITADLVNRAADLIMVPLFGVPATIWLARRKRAVPGLADA